MTRILAAVLAVLLCTAGLATIASAQTDDCYPVPPGGCETEPPSEPPTLEPSEPQPPTEDPTVPPAEGPTTPTATETESDEAIAGDKPGGIVQVAAQSAPAVLAQTGAPAVVLMVVVVLTLAAGAVLLLTTRRRAE